MRRSRVRISVGPFYLWLLCFKGYLLDYNRKYLIRDGDLKNTGIVSNEDGTRRSSRSSTVIQVWIQVKYLVSRIYFSQRAVEVSNMPKQKWNRQNPRVIRLLVSFILSNRKWTGRIAFGTLNCLAIKWRFKLDLISWSSLNMVPDRIDD